MDFKLSYEWLSEYVDVRLSPEKLAEVLSLHSVSVEHVRRMDEGFGGVVLGKILSIAPHPNADKLSIAQVDIGVRRIQVIFGRMAIVHVGDRIPVAVAPTTLPGGAEILAKDLRGARSEGMLCLDQELGLAPESEPPKLRYFEPSVKVGTPIAKALGLDSVVFDVEVTTNRPDLMSVEELAREVAAITGARMRAPVSPKPTAPSRKPKGSNSLQLRIDDRSACPRYGAAVIDGVHVGPSPWWMQRRLLAAGLRPINNVVDVTNYVMLELGQPLHAFDADRLRRRNHESGIKNQGAIGIAVRRATAGESLTTLDGVTRALSPEVLVIADAARPIALAGIMGGKEAGVTDATTRIVLECANFDPMVIRRGARCMNVRTDASTRFEKGLQPEAIDAVIPRAIELLCAVTGGTAGKATIAGGRVRPLRPVTFRPSDASARIGIPIVPSAMRRTLTALGCRVTGTGSTWRVTPPWWRRGDIEHPHDLVEEIARIAGYHTLPSVLPPGTLPAAVRPPAPPITVFGWEDRARALLAATGGTEIMTSSLTSRVAVTASGFTEDRCIVLENPLSEELVYLRPSMLSTLLPAIAANQEHTPKGVVFELGNVYIPQASGVRNQRAKTVLPREEMRLVIATYGRLMSGGHVMQLKGMTERLLDRLGITNVTFRRSESCVLPSGVCLWHPGRTMDVIVGETLVGVLGEVHPAVVEQFRIDARVAVAELDWAPILIACGTRRDLGALPEFPAVKRDLAFTVDRKTAYADVVAVLDAFDPLLTHVELFDTFEGGGIPMGKKSIAFHLTYSATDRTLTAAAVDALQARLVQTLRERFGAEVRA
ncbi:MAG: phenylalanine--tRNA ligase subunit beta [bacterium]|nr:phenylalanine--tRNA ligase subunit beta [bacterium]